MKHLSSIVLTAAVLAAGTVACFKDPTSAARKGPSRIVLTRSTIMLGVNGDSEQVQAELKDEQGNTYDVADAQWTSSNTAVAVVNVDTSQYLPYHALTRAFVHTTGAGRAWVYIETHGIKDSIQVYGLPTVFDGTVAHVANPTLNDTITINGTAALTFTTTGGDTSVVSTSGRGVWMLSRSATQLKFVAVAAANMPVCITNLVLNGVVHIAGLCATSTLTVTDPTEPGNDDPATPASMTLYKDYHGTVGSADADDFVAFTTTTADSVRIEVQWQTDSDLDGYLLNAAGGGYGVLDGYAMASSANPEAVNVRLAAATTYQIDVNLYDIGSADDPVQYRIRTIKLQ